MKPHELEANFATVHALLVAEDMIDAAELVRLYPGRAEQTGYDNWNGGTEIWEVYLEVPPTHFTQMGAQRSKLQEQINARLKTVLETETQDWYSAKIIPAKNYKTEWREAGSDVPYQTRVNIFDGLRLECALWHGTLNQVEFLSRIFQLENMPSSDSRFENAAGDIWQHCINNEDWELDWVFSDKRFNLLECSPDIFLNFLCEIVNPVVRPDRDDALKLVSHFNDQLRPVGKEIFEQERIAGRPRFAHRTLKNNDGATMLRVRSVADSLDAGWMAKAIERLERSIDSDPDLAIGTAKELVESCCKTILAKRDVSVTKSDDLGKLTKKLTRDLRLVPEGISDESKGAENIRLILRNLTQLTNNLAQLRGLYGTGHGRDGQHRGLQPRHARLAVASAVAFIEFVTETYRCRESAETTSTTAS